jgi:hypothetical protein
MGIWIGILGSVAAAALFFIIEPYLLATEQPWRVVGTAGVFLISTALALLLRKREVAQEKSGGGILSDNDVGNAMNARVEDTELTGTSKNKVLSGNKIGGSADFEIKNSKL